MKFKATKTLVLLAALIVSFTPIMAQQDGSLKKNSQNPLRNKYKDYEALILADYGKVEFVINHEGGFDIIFTRKTHYQINTASGLSWTEIEIPLYVGKYERETLEEVSLAVMNPESGIVRNYKEDELDIFTDKRTKNYEIKTFAVPNAHEGSVIEVVYSYRSPYKYNLDDWYFQYSIPVLYSQVKVTIVPFYEYLLLKRGPRPLDSFHNIDAKVKKEFHTVPYRERTFVYIMSDVPAFDDESFITNKADYINRLEFQLHKVTNTRGIVTPVMTDWPAVNKELLSNSHFGKYVSASEKHSKKAGQAYAKMCTNTGEIADAITSHVKHHIKWNDRSQKFTNESPKKIMEEGEGNSAEINLYLVGMLKAAGLDAFPVLLSTRKHGKVYKDVPMHNNFNYVIAGIKTESGIILRDATDPHYPDDKLPIRCLNGQGLVVQKESNEWVPLGTGNLDSKISHTVIYEFPDDGEEMKSTVNITSTGYEAISQLKRTGNDPEEARKLYSNDLITEIDSVVLKNGEVMEDSFSIEFTALVQKESIANRIFIHPFADLAEKECKLTKKTRSYPVDMVYERSNHFMSKIPVPEGYEPGFVPMRYVVSNDLMTVRYCPELKDNVLSIEAEMSFHKRIYQPKDYKKLRYFYSDMVKKLNEVIILEQVEETGP